MRRVLIAGAGKSAAYLIDYMLSNSKKRWNVVVMDSNPEMVVEKLGGHPNGEAAIIDVHDEDARKNLVRQSDIVLSLLPPDLHYLLAEDCLQYKKNLITSSYLSEEIKSLHAEVKKSGLLFMCEMGLDPGIDHMSCASIINAIHRIAADITGFKSFCGGLVSPDSDDNPWKYKMSWNPKNIVLAGKQGAKWLESGKERSLSYQQLFKENKKIKIDDVGVLGYYPNRDSLKYLELYGLDEVKTFMRATLRFPHFLKGWEIIVDLGLTDEKDSYEINRNITYSEWLADKAGLSHKGDLKEDFQKKFGLDDKRMKMLIWLGLFDDRKISTGILQMKQASSADILTSILSQKWKMNPIDKDMVVMQHQVDYERKGIPVKLTSTMVVKGENRLFSAMSKTVGLPIGILAKKILLGEINVQKISGVQIPIMTEVSGPVLKELKKNGIEFTEIIK